MPATTDDGLFKHTYDAWNRLNDESLQDSAILPDPDVIAEEIVEGQQAALDPFAQISADSARG